MLKIIANNNILLQLHYSIYKGNFYLSKPILNLVLTNYQTNGKKDTISVFFSRALFCSSHQQLFAQTNSLGIFDGQDDVGRVKHKGTGAYDSKLQDYHLSGSGTNIWTNHDEFHFVWKKMKGDFILRTNAEFIGKGVEEHRKNRLNGPHLARL